MAAIPNLNAGPLSIELPGTSFLDLPAEIRIKIYRLAFVFPNPISAGMCYEEIEVKETLETIGKICPRIHDEAYTVFEAENTWEMEIKNNGSGWSETSFASSLLDLDSDYRRVVTLRSIRDKRRFFIKVCWVGNNGGDEIDEYDDIDVFRRNLRVFMWFLKTIPAIDYLRIQCFEADKEYPGSDPLRSCEWPDDELGQVLLTYVGELRRVKEVKIRNIPKEFAKPLKKKIMGDTPLSPWPDMYHRLEKYLGKWTEYKQQLKEARLAMETGEHQRFLKIRDEILQQVRARMAEMEEQVYLKDPGMPQESQDTSTPDFSILI